eukprot:g16724.t2
MHVCAERLTIWNNLLSGSIPGELGQLTALQRLFFATNQLTGSIPPELGRLAALQRLELLENKLTGSIPPALGQLAALIELDLSTNGLTGSIPPALGQLAALQRLKLLQNKLTGSIPEELGQLAALIDLDLSRNQLTGSIPPELGQLAALIDLDLSRNQLTGSIPPELGQLAALIELDLSTNKLTGSIPPKLGQLTALQRLELLENQLTGPIPLLELRNVTALQRIGISGNRLSENDMAEFKRIFPGAQFVENEARNPQPVVEYDFDLPIAAEAPSGRDGLNYEVYVKSLADLFSNNDHNVLPAAVGIYAPWGSGKTFLLEMLEEKLLNREKGRDRVPGRKCCRCLKVLKRRLLVVVFWFVIRELGKWVRHKCCPDSPYRVVSNDPEAGGNGSSTGASKPRKFIFVKFNAWEYGGSELLWASLASNIFTAIENHKDFGRGIVREKRVKELLKKRIWDWFGLFEFFVVIAFLGVVTVALLKLKTSLISDTTTGVGASAASVVGAAVLTFVKFLLQVRSQGVFDTAQGVLRKAYDDGKKSVGDAHLGFMSEVKEELRILFELISDYNTKRESKGERGVTVAVIVDDLDRCAPDKILQTLQAAHLLLQQPEAQMVVFLAVDPRIIVSAIDKKLEDVPDEEGEVFTALFRGIKTTPRKIKRTVNVPCRVSGLVCAAQNNEEVEDIATLYDNFVSGNRSKESLEPLYLNDSPERSFSEALKRKGPNLSRTQVLEFLPYSVGLNPAILSVVEAEMVEANREAAKVEERRRDAAD